MIDLQYYYWKVWMKVLPVQEQTGGLMLYYVSQHPAKPQFVKKETLNSIWRHRFLAFYKRQITCER